MHGPWHVYFEPTDSESVTSRLDGVSKCLQVKICMFMQPEHLVKSDGNIGVVSGIWGGGIIGDM